MNYFRRCNMILSHRRCYRCGREERDIGISTCPECGHFMHPIGYCYVPVSNEKRRAGAPYEYNGSYRGEIWQKARTERGN